MSGRGAAQDGGAATFRGGVREALPVVLGYLSIGFAAGVVQRASGLSVAEVMLMSLLLYAGSAQFVVAGLIATAQPGGLPVAAIVVAVFLVNLRHLLLSASLAPHFTRVTATRSALLGLQLTDETFVVAWSAIARGALPERGRAAWMSGLNLSAYCSWAAANLAGALASGLLSDTRALGFDFALPAMFGALLALQLSAQRGAPGDAPASGFRGRHLLAAALAGGALAAGIRLFAPGQWNIMAATVAAATLVLVLEHRWTSDRKS